MRQGDPSDPLLRQVLPLAEELDSPPGFTSDAVGDSAAMLSPGLLQPGMWIISIRRQQ